MAEKTAAKRKATAKVRIAKFEASDFLKSEIVIREFLAAAMEDDNPDVFLAALGEVAKVRGIAAIAEQSGLGRESLYKTLAPGAKPRYETICKLIHALGVKLTVKAA
jgi:probable addiction module antidote protein